jgi:hypothetical protein
VAIATKSYEESGSRIGRTTAGKATGGTAIATIGSITAGYAIGVFGTVIGAALGVPAAGTVIGTLGQRLELRLLLPPGSKASANQWWHRQGPHLRFA